ncbi:hypothetical protein TRIUR3_24836 [Triticum urartu]|uniref:Pleckstrin-like plant domain-containing protein n=1 Tax=Triticum urartu TaxID=4572 RepID=M7ZH38_TRIUA|nr:hypothetical protein TRIUR3_24836 [Triticum urartu]
MSEVADHDEWDRNEQFEMSNQFSHRLNELDDAVGFRYYWVFVRHPRWRPDEPPWQQWTLSAEVAVQASKDQRLDKWSLMGRFGNSTRELITRCAAWMRPDILYVKRPLYQSRFEPQEEFFSRLRPLVDPSTENQFLFDLEQDGRVIQTTYFGGLCRIVKASPKSYVDDVVNAYSKLSEADKSRCLEFLLTNHPMELLHPYTKEWKVKLEEMELGCDAPDESDDEGGDEIGSEIIDWVEDEEVDVIDDTEDDVDNDYEDEEVVDVSEEVEADEVIESSEENEDYWDEQWDKAMKSNDKMEKLVKNRVEKSYEYNKRQMQQQKDMESQMGTSNTMIMQQEQAEEDERNDRSLVVDDSGFGGTTQPQWKYDDLKSWIWLQKAIHPELDYDNKKKWVTLRGAAALRGRRGGSGGHGQSERADQGGTAPWQDDLDFDFNYARSKAALAKGDELFVAMPDGKWKLHTVSAATDRNGKVVLRIKKMNLVMQAFSNTKECVVEDVRPCAPEKASREGDATYPVEVRTSRGKVELRADDYAVYKRWVTTVTHMLTSSTAITMRN